uniref:60S acidic ribosomal protein P0 n=1 Tax=Schistosoma japonicum TaxID=6182 RepID=C1L908_SCHJA|nr:deoxyribonuclease [Schistosoma japonicum]
MVRLSRSEWKAGYFKKLEKHLSEFDKCFIVNVDNVRSKQMQQIRMALRGNAELVLGKNTLMRKVIQKQMNQDSNLEKILPHIRDNVGFVFTNGDLSEVRKTIENNRVEAPAKAGAIAPCDVVVPAQNTGLGPEKTAFFQALSIPTKIARGAIEIINDVHLVRKDEKVGMSEATLLGMLKIHPFSYGLVIKQIFDQGCVYDPAVLDITPEMIIEKFAAAVRNIACLSLALDYTTLCSLPHVFANGFKNMLAISLMTDYSFKEAEKIKEFMEEPSLFITVTTPVAAEVPATSAKVVETSAPAEAPSEESDDDMGFGLFD